MATWHQTRAGLTGLYSPPLRGFAVIVDQPGRLAWRIDFEHRADADRLARRTGGQVLEAAPTAQAPGRARQGLTVARLVDS